MLAADAGGSGWCVLLRDESANPLRVEVRLAYLVFNAVSSRTNLVVPRSQRGWGVPAV